jgi:hypothetical protein
MIARRDGVLSEVSALAEVSGLSADTIARRRSEIELNSVPLGASEINCSAIALMTIANTDPAAIMSSLTFKVIAMVSDSRDD